MVAVRCQHCGARYDTDLPLRAIERIRRCSRCGYPALVPLADDERRPAEAEHAETPPTHHGGGASAG